MNRQKLHELLIDSYEEKFQENALARWNNESPYSIGYVQFIEDLCIDYLKVKLNVLKFKKYQNKNKDVPEISTAQTTLLDIIGGIDE